MTSSSQSQPPAPARSFWQNSLARLLGIPLIYWVLSVFSVVFFAYYVVPIFLNDYHELRVYPDFPAINPIGGDLREYMGFSKALLEDGSPYIPPNYYPPLQALLFAPLVRFGPDQSYAYITPLNFLSFLAIAWLYPWLASRPRQWNQLATLLLMLLFGAAYFSTLFYHPDLPIPMANKMPALMVMAASVTGLAYIRAAQARRLGSPAEFPDLA